MVLFDLLMGISPKVCVIVWHEFELTYILVQFINQYITGTPALIDIY